MGLRCIYEATEQIQNMIEILGITNILFQCIMMIATIFMVQRQLKNNFEKKGNRR